MAWARTARSRKPTTPDNIETNVHSGKLRADEVRPLLDDLNRRGIFQEKDGAYFPVLDLFTSWLRDYGFSSLIVDQLGDELAEAKQRQEDEAFVRSAEITEISEKWGLYRGREINAEKVRAWIEQVESHVDQRLLFKLLENVRFVQDAEIEDMFAQAHRRLRSELPTFVSNSRHSRRDDILVSYADGLGKSGAYYAQIYAQKNKIISKNIITPDSICDALRDMDKERSIGVAIVDDMIGTGYNLMENLSRFSSIFQDDEIRNSVFVSIVTLCGTKTGEERVREYLDGLEWNADLEICETLEDKHFAFHSSTGFWSTDEEKRRAKALVVDLGSRVQPNNPLGFSDQGLLLTFSRNCPNNSLPILHGSSKKKDKIWTPLFPRVKM